MNLSSKKRTVLLRHPTFNLSLADARLSPDGRWIAFPVPFAPHRSRLAIARVSRTVIDNERDWTYLMPETMNSFQPALNRPTSFSDRNSPSMTMCVL